MQAKKVKVFWPRNYFAFPKTATQRTYLVFWYAKEVLLFYLIISVTFTATDITKWLILSSIKVTSCELNQWANFVNNIYLLKQINYISFPSSHKSSNHQTWWGVDLTRWGASTYQFTCPLIMWSCDATWQNKIKSPLLQDLWASNYAMCWLRVRGFRHKVLWPLIMGSEDKLKNLSHEKLKMFHLHLHKTYKHQVWWGGELGKGLSLTKSYAPLIIWSRNATWKNKNISHFPQDL